MQNEMTLFDHANRVSCELYKLSENKNLTDVERAQFMAAWQVSISAVTSIMRRERAAEQEAAQC